MISMAIQKDIMKTKGGASKQPKIPTNTENEFGKRNCFHETHDTHGLRINKCFEHDTYI